MAETRRTGALDQVEHVGRSGIYPASGPMPPGTATIRRQGEFGHPEERRRRVITDAARRALPPSGLLIMAGGLGMLATRGPGASAGWIITLAGGAMLAAALRTAGFNPLPASRGGGLPARVR